MKQSQRIQAMLAQLNQGVYEKEEVMALAFLAAISGESIFLLGAPGVAKSLIARRLKFAFHQATSFEYLMNRFSTPDEIFGPVSIAKLKNEDIYERKTQQYLPEAQVVFLDEIWKAGPSIQNALLTVLNEKVYRNGAQEIKLPMKALISASNELPAKGEGLEALWDRFLIRYLVTNISNADNFSQMISEELDVYADNIDEELKITEVEYQAWSKEISTIQIPQEVFHTISVIREKIAEYNSKNADNQIYVSDRRWRKIIRILRTSAFLNDRKIVNLMDCMLIAACIWDCPTQIKTIQEILELTLKKHSYSVQVDYDTMKMVIQDLEKEIQTETTQEIPIEGESERITFDGMYYQLDGLEDILGGNRISIADFNRRMPDRELFVPLFDSENRHVKNIFIKSIPRNKSRLLVDIDNYGNIGTKMKDISRKNIKFKQFILLSQAQFQYEYQEVAPNFMFIEDWDKTINGILKQIDLEITKIEKYRKLQSAGIKQHLFVPAKYAKWIEHNLVLNIDILQKMKLDVQLMQRKYHTLFEKSNDFAKVA
ncbi:MAG: AAA family ATPase [Bacteroidia bacterium]